VTGDVDVAVRRIGPTEQHLAGSIAELVNRAYAPAVLELWTSPFDRVSADAVADYIVSGELLVAESDGTPIGCVRYRELDSDTGWFGLLAVDPVRTGSGVGRILVDAVEATAAGAGRTWMELDLLIPAVAMPRQSLLQDWYGRLGYVEISREEFRMRDDELSAAIRSPCVSVRQRKLLNEPARGIRKE
jgi:GNAT superfamily N-acetyltransferase